MSVRLLREFISLIIEGNDDDDEDKINRSATPDDWRSNRDVAFTTDIDELIGEPEFETIEAFVNYKIDNDEYEFSTSELQALALNVDAKRLGHGVTVAAQATVTSIKRELIDDFGFRFVPRQPTRYARGSMSSGHGRHPFAGSGAGGSGFGTGFGGPSFTSFGGGPGAIGSGVEWKSGDKKNLPMGSRRGR